MTSKRIILPNSGKREAGRERGASAVEFALVLPLLLLLLYGIVQYGTIFLVRHELTEAAADAARASVTVAQASAATVAQAQAAEDLSNDSDGLIKSPSPCNASTPKLQCTVTTVACPNEPAADGLECLTVTLRYEYGDAPVFPDLFGIPLPTVTASSTVLLAGSGGST